MSLRALLLTLLFALNILVLWAPSVSAAGVAAFLLFFLPGVTFAFATRLAPQDPLARVAFAMACGFVGALFAVVALALLPGTPSMLRSVAVLGGVSAFGILRIPAAFSTSTTPRRDWMPLTLLIILSIGLRSVHLGVAEFQGDEARAMLLASGFAAGDHGIIYLHRKGPAEAFLAAPALMLLGKTSEAAARFPFALAGGLLPLFAFVLARRIAGATTVVSLAAAALVSCDGFLFAFSRIVQYQTPLVLFLGAAFLTGSLVPSKQAPLRAAVSMTAIFFVAALLCHYDAVFAAPALALYLWSMLRQRGASRAEIARAASSAAVWCCALAGMFYLPFLLHDHFSGTAGYLSQRLGVQKLPVHNIARYLSLLTFYGGGFSAVVAYGGALLGVLWWSLHLQPKPLRVLALAGAVLLVSTTLVVQSPSHSRLLAALGALGLLLLVGPLLCSPGEPLHRRVLLWWIVVPLCALGFFFARPNTHFYVLHLPLAIVAAVVFSERIICWGKTARWVSGFVGALVFVGSLAYLYTAYLNPAIEYRFEARKAVPWFTRPFFASGMAPGPYFGFQRRSGWKAAAALYQRGALAGSYGSNEEELVTSWYLWPQVRNQGSPQSFLIAARPNDPVRVSQSMLASQYHFWGRVYVAGQRRIEIFASTPPPNAPQPFQLEEFIETFNARNAVFPDARTALAGAPSR